MRKRSATLSRKNWRSRTISATLLAIFSSSAHAWNGPDHQMMGRLALQEVSKRWGLDRPVAVHPLESLLKKLPICIDSNSMGIVRGRAGSPPDFSEPSGCASGERIDPWHFSDWLQINPAVNLEQVLPAVREKSTLTPLEILSTYAIDPDDGRDQDLFVRDAKGRPRPRYPDQKWFGALAGANSQAFRHIEKPPFSFRHPAATFGFPPRAVGEATRRAEIWFLASQLAFTLREDYWGWRFLANAFHYLQDLHNPFHAGQVTPRLLAKGLLAYGRWGWRKGFVETVAHVVGNAHRFFEGIVATPPAIEWKQQAIRNLGGTDLVATAPAAPAAPPEAVRKLAAQVRDASNLELPDLVAAVEKITTPELWGPHEFKSDPPAAPAAPAADSIAGFLKKEPAVEAVQRQLFTLVEERFRSSGRVLRTVTRMALDQRQTRSADELFEEIGRLTGVNPLRRTDEDEIGP